MGSFFSLGRNQSTPWADSHQILQLHRSRQGFYRLIGRQEDYRENLTFLSQEKEYQEGYELPPYEFVIIGA